MNHKLGLVVPYKNRPEQLQQFKKSILSYIQDIDYELIIVDQVDDNDFNRGKLLNIGFLHADKLGCDYVVFHDIDMLPIDVDYGYSDTVLHLIDDLQTPEGFDRVNFDEYFGGVTLFPSTVFKNINGYTNEYWGWGFEDDNLMLRCRSKKVKLGSKVVSQKSRDGIQLELDGSNSFVACPNVFNNVRDFSIFINFTIDKINSFEDNITDVNSVFSIPGFDTALTYNSFRNFAFQFWKKDLSSMNIHSNHFPEGTYSAIITIENKSNPKKVTFYLNGEKIGDLAYDKLYDIKSSKYFYLGAGNPERSENQNFMKGGINSFAVFNEVLSDIQIKKLSTNIHHSLFNLHLPTPLTYYDGKFLRDNTLIDLSGNGNDATAFGCKVRITKKSTETTVDIPLRRKGKFQALAHEENGYTKGYWKSWQSRENQLDYYKKYYNNNPNLESDGLSTLFFTPTSTDTDGNYHHLKVKLT